MMKKILIGLGIGLGILFVLSLGFVFKPVPIVTEEKAIIEKGIIDSIYEGGINDIVFILENNDTKFYINRGLEKGLDLKTLQQQLEGQEVKFMYPKYWTPLDWNNKTIHLSKVEIGTEILFNELKNK